MTLALHYDFATDKSLVAQAGPTLSFARTGVATYFDASGVMQTAGTGVARYSHNPVTLASLGLMVEGSSENIAKQSEDLSTTWSAVSNGVVNVNQAVAPDGATTADELIDDNGGGTGFAQLRQSWSTFQTSTAYTMSAYCKKNGNDWIWMRIQGMGALAISAYFDLTNGVVGATLGANNDAQGIEDVGSGWYRCWISFTSDSSDTIANWDFFVADTNNDITVARDNTSSVYIWGCQMEARAKPSSYIKTTTTAVTRNADVPTTTTLSWLDAAATANGTFYVKGSFPYVDAAANALLTLDDGGTTDRFYFERDAAENINFQTTNSADTNGASDGAGVIAADTEFEVAAGYADDNIHAYVDGISSGADATAGIPLTDNPTTLRIGHDSGGNYWEGYIAEVRYYDERFVDATVALISSGSFPPYQFPGTTAGDGGPVWPPRSNDPRWAQLITDSGITASGNFIDDVHQALEALGSTTGDMDTLWKKVKAANSVTDTSEPYLY